jgi:hypothetical protein
LFDESGAVRIVASSRERRGARRFVLEEDLGLECKDFHVAAPPRVDGKPGLAANAVEKPLTIPSLLDRHLGKEQAATTGSHDLQTIPTDP